MYRLQSEGWQEPPTHSPALNPFIHLRSAADPLHFLTQLTLHIRRGPPDILEIPMLEKRAFTEPEAAAYTGMSRSYLRQARMNGPLANRTPPPRHVKIGAKAIRYMREDLDAWLEQWREKTSS